MQSWRPTTRRRKDQGGFILLVIFLMAAAIAMMLYQQLPRVAFESERDKEQLLIERGEQYKRAIELYAKANGGSLPQKLDDLEKGSTSGKRYLRRRYIDPYTGKDEWRLVHSNGQQLTDSLVQPPPGANGATGATGATGSNSSASGNTSGNSANAAADQSQQVNAQVGLRPSDVTLPGNQSFNGPNPGAISAVNGQLTNPQGFPTPQAPSNGANNPQGFNGAPVGPGGVPIPGFGIPGAGLPAGVQLPGVATRGAVGQTPNGFQPQFPGQQFPGQVAPPGVQAGGATNGFQPQFPGQQFAGQLPPNGGQATGATGATGPTGSNPQFPGQQFPGQQFPGQQPNITQSQAGLPGSGGGNAAVNAINQLLTNPRTAAQGTLSSGNSTGGIAGVASAHTGPSIKTYNDRQKYQEWEFVYTPTAAGARGPTGPTGPTGQRK